MPDEKKAVRLAGKLLDLCFDSMRIKKDGQEEAIRILQNGTALKKFKDIIKAQNGNKSINSDDIKIKAKRKDLESEKYGNIKKINNQNLNMIAKILGAPENKHSGIYLFKKINDKVEKNEPLMSFYSKNQYQIQEATVSLKVFPIYEIEK